MGTDGKETKCPFWYLWQDSDQSSNRPPPVSDNDTNPSSQPVEHETKEILGECPLGFGSSRGRGSHMGRLHCIVCRSIMYQASTTRCGHTYCKNCIEKFQDCPTCGADVVGVKENAAVDQAIEEFLSAHAGSIQFWDLQGDDLSRSIEKAKDAPEKPVFERMQDRATFYVQAGMRAMSGGNGMGAAHWFGRAKEILEEGGDFYARQDFLASLGTVYGALGDCHKAMGDTVGAMAWYQKSIDTLTAATAVDVHGVEASDPFHALSVTLNKVGEMYHRQGDVERALDMYTKALKVRRDRFDTCSAQDIPCERSIAMMIDIATSQAKVADAMSICGRDGDAQKMNAETVQLVESIDISQCRSASTHAKYTRLKEYLQNA